MFKPVYFKHESQAVILKSKAYVFSSSELKVYITHPRAVTRKVNGQLVMLGFDVSIFTPASYQRCSLQRP